MNWPALALLVLVIAILIWRGFIRDRKEYARFRRLRTTLARQKTLRQWLIQAFVIFGGLSVVVLLASWPWIADALADARAWPPIAWIVDTMPPWVAVALGLAFLVGLALPAILLRGSEDEVPTLGDVQALLPRTRGELPYGLGLSLNAGLFEELLFRLGMPALVYAVTGSALLSFIGCAVLFGALHAYQGPVGALVATVLGALFTLLYLVSGTILVPVVVHALIDLRSLVLIPVALGRMKKPAPGPASASVD